MLQIVELTVKKLEHDDHVEILCSQRKEYGDEIDLKMLDLEVEWPYDGVFEFVANSIHKKKTNFPQNPKSPWYSGEFL